MRPFFTYYGGKWRSAPRYPAPRHRTIVEPFAGSAGYAVRYNAPRVLLVDKDPAVVGTWRYLVGASAEEIMRLPDLEPGETVHDLAVPAEARNLIGWWLNPGSKAPCNVPSAWMRSGINPGSFWGEKVRARIAAQVGSIRHWEVREGSYEELDTDLLATWFVDPPYQVSGGRHYKFCSVDYRRLGDWCRSLIGQVIVCEGPGADWLPFEHAFDALGTPGKRRGRTGLSREFVWYGPAEESDAAA